MNLHFFRLSYLIHICISISVLQPSADEALRDLGTFAFVTLHLFYAGGRHLSAVAELLRLIDRLEELHTEVQGMISSPHLYTTLLFNV